LSRDHGQNGTFPRAGERNRCAESLRNGDLVGFGSLTVQFSRGAPLATPTPAYDRTC